MGTVNTQIPTKVGNAMKADGLKVVLNPNLSYDGVYSASRNSIEMKNNVDYGFMHEIGHYVDRKTGYVSGSTEFKNIFNSEKSKYKGFYSDWNLDSGIMQEQALLIILQNVLEITTLVQTPEAS